MPRLSRRIIITTLGILLYGISIGVSMSMFNNFLHDTYHLTAEARGQLEFPRELPGFLSVFLVSALFFLGDKWKAVLAACIAGVGQYMMVTMDSRYLMMVLFMMMWSVGDHLYFPIKSALILASGDEKNRGKLLGTTGSFEVMGIIIGGLLTRWLAHIDSSYYAMFCCASAANIAAGITFATLPRDQVKTRLSLKMLFHRRYKLYYVLEFLFGARKQIFLTFGPWVLIQVFHRGVGTFAVLTVIGHGMALFTRPAAGWLIDRLGERIILMMDGFLLIFVCLGYAFANHFPIASLCLPIALGCYLLDQTLFFIDIARTSYISKRVDHRSELSSCLSAGVSVNHIASMTIPFFAGSLWAATGHEVLFVGASGFAMLIIFAASRIKLVG